uniref:Uncharacterized protein n=1 Tax=Lutzomyia longipalpis TaxID=7200 RepID=A0A1B0CP53_LUTLO
MRNKTCSSDFLLGIETCNAQMYIILINPYKSFGIALGAHTCGGRVYPANELVNEWMREKFMGCFSYLCNSSSSLRTVFHNKTFGEAAKAQQQWIKPLHDAYQKEIEVTLCEPLNTFWAECYESCKRTGKLCKEIEMESRTKFQEKIIMPWRYRQSEEIHRQNAALATLKADEVKCDRLYRQFRRSLYGARGPWSKRSEEKKVIETVQCWNFNAPSQSSAILHLRVLIFWLLNIEENSS